MIGVMYMRPGKATWNQSTIKRSLQILPKTDQRKIIAIAIIQVFLSMMDLIGVLLIGFLGTLSVTGLQSQQPGNKVRSILEIFGIQDFSFQTQASVLGILAVLILVGRTLLSIIFTRRILYFLSQRGAKISAELISRLLAQPLLKIQKRTSQEILFAVTTGVGTITLQVLATSVVLISDVALLIIMAVGLFLVNPITAVSTVSIFSIIAYFLYKFMHVNAGSLGEVSTKLNVESNERIIEVFGSYRELVVRNRRDFYSKEIGKLRYRLANTSAEMAFMPYVSKYVIETAVIVGALFIGGIAFLLQDAQNAVATLAIFMAAGTRIAPAVLRIQQSLIQIRGSIGQSIPTLELIEELGSAHSVEDSEDDINTTHEGFSPNVTLENVSLTYPGNQSASIKNVSLQIDAGSFVAIVGPSGAGKTSLIDLILGVLEQDSGQIRISELHPQSTVRKWPGAVAYVPQDVILTSGTVRENIALGYPVNLATDEIVKRAVSFASLDDFILSLPDGLDTKVGERGAKLSGGQRQRVGIARAILTMPKLLVLDEATSALDGETEHAISQGLDKLRGDVTIIIAAHRLSTIMNADSVIYMKDGVVVDVGNFEELRLRVPDFNSQAKLMGL